MITTLNQNQVPANLSATRAPREAAQSAMGNKQPNMAATLPAPENLSTKSQSDKLLDTFCQAFSKFLKTTLSLLPAKPFRISENYFRKEVLVQLLLRDPFIWLDRQPGSQQNVETFSVNLKRRLLNAELPRRSIIAMEVAALWNLSYYRAQLTKVL